MSRAAIDAEREPYDGSLSLLDNCLLTVYGFMAIDCRVQMKIEATAKRFVFCRWTSGGRGSFRGICNPCSWSSEVIDSNKVAVAGGSIFRAATADELTKRGFEVTIFDNVESQQLNDNQKMIIGDSLDKTQLSRVFEESRHFIICRRCRYR